MKIAIETLEHHWRSTSADHKPDLCIAGWTIDSGAQIAISGPSGSGKSTLLCALSGATQPTRGRVQVGEYLLNQMDAEERAAVRRHHIGVVFQRTQLVPWLSVVDNITLPYRMLHGVTPPSESFPSPSYLLGRLALTEHSEKHPHELSEGQAQRVCVARALAARPSLVLADEPTSAQDPALADQVAQTLSTVAKQLQATLIVVTHDPSVAAHLDQHVSIESLRAGEA